MNIGDIELKLLAAEPVEIKDCESIHIPTLRHVVKIGESKYNQLLSVTLFDKDNMDEKFEEYDNFDIVFLNCYHSEQFREMFYEAIELFFKQKAQMCDVKTSTDAFFYFENGGRIHKGNFDQIQEIVRIGNHVKKVKKEEDYRPGNEVTAKIIAEMLERRKKKKQPKSDINLQSMISALSWKSGTPNHQSVLNLSMYQFYDGYRRIERLDSIHYTLFGIYTGNVDTKKINMKDLSFAKIIET